MMDTWMDRLFILVFGSLLLGVVIFVFSLVGLGIYQISGYPCANTAEKLGVRGSYSISTGCMYQIQGQWVHKEHVIPVERDGKIVLVPAFPYRQDHEIRVK